MSAITTHILDVSRGKPAAGVLVVLERAADGGKSYQELGRGHTDDDGRLRTLLAPGSHLVPGGYRLTFEVAPYFDKLGIDAFYPEISIGFSIKNPSEHYHVPLLLSPFGYSTYRGS